MPFLKIQQKSFAKKKKRLQFYIDMSESTNISTQSGQINQTQSKQPAKDPEYQITDSSDKQSITEPKPELSAKQELLERYCGLEQLTEGKITKGEELGSGGQGTIYEGTLETNGKTTNIIIKEDITDADIDTDIDGVEHETRASSELMNKAKANLIKGDNLISSQEGFANVVFQQEINGQHVQRKVTGVDGRKAIGNIKNEESKDATDERIDLYKTETGRPKNIHQPLMLARQLLNGVHAIHEQGKIHGDLKPQNIMLEQTKETVTLDDGSKKQTEVTNLEIIDLGLAVKQGENYIGYSSNAAPEVKYSCNHNTICKARTTADIYTANTILCELLFGRYDEHFHELFYRARVAENIKREYNESTKKITQNEIPKWLKRLLQKANELPNGEQLYPPAIYQAIEDLIVRMCAINPEDRPSAQYCLAVLNDIALCTEAMQNGIKIEKPMITGTTLQATQLISGLNELNKKAELTPKEKETREVLIYNLQRNFCVDESQQALIEQTKQATLSRMKTELKGLKDKLGSLDVHDGNLYTKITTYISVVQEGKFPNPAIFTSLENHLTLLTRLKNLQTQLENDGLAESDLCKIASKCIDDLNSMTLICTDTYIDFDDLATQLTTLNNLQAKLKKAGIERGGLYDKIKEGINALSNLKLLETNYLKNLKNSATQLMTLNNLQAKLKKAGIERGGLYNEIKKGISDLSDFKSIDANGFENLEDFVTQLIRVKKLQNYMRKKGIDYDKLHQIVTDYIRNLNSHKFVNNTQTNNLTKQIEARLR